MPQMVPGLCRDDSLSWSGREIALEFRSRTNSQVVRGPRIIENKKRKHADIFRNSIVVGAMMPATSRSILLLHSTTTQISLTRYRVEPRPSRALCLLHLTRTIMLLFLPVNPHSLSVMGPPTQQ
ncbi:hypothetical protein KQX54_015598 [Cotesia glomerata]|uniref:Uncharacterized protein n=1 Tax=Cotesia glomerata TaxID=32391 RepID=A0AAV7IHK1_COTGL|nr:hypothetical protein KQX54_015598 [Cotesia glomerata]